MAPGIGGSPSGQCGDSAGDDALALSNAHVGVIGACPRPYRLTGVETLLNGHTITDGLIRHAASTAAEEVDPPDDLHGDAAYRRGLVATLIARGLRAAAQNGGA